MSVTQERRLLTDLPGPKSRELQARKSAAVAAGVGVGLPAYISRAGGGIVEDVDGNHLIDFGSGIAVTSVGNAAERVVRNVQQQLEQFTHTCFMVTPYEGYVEVCEALAELTPGDHAKRSALFNSGAEAVENAVKIARVDTRSSGGDRLRARLPRTHEPDDGPDVEEHAVQAGLWPFRRRGLPGADGLPVRWPGGPDACADEAAAPAIDRAHPGR